MKFLLQRTLQNKPVDPPIPLDVTPKRREGYDSNCGCRWVFAIDAAAHEELIARRLLLKEQQSKLWVVCSCCGTLTTEAVEGLLARDERPEPYMPTLSRAMVAWDMESTGIDPVLDRIVQLGVTVLDPDGTRRRWETLINPVMPIPQSASEIHGIADTHVASAPKFRDIAGKFLAGLAGKDMLLYNGRRLDLPILDEELRRCGLRLNLEGVRVIDAFTIFQKREPRDLSAFVQRYAGRDHSGAHGAAADAEGTLDGYLGMLAEYEDLRLMTLDQQAQHSMYGDDPDRAPADLAGKLYSKGGEIYFAFGKAKDKSVAEEPGFAQWILRCGDPPFPGSTCDVLRAELKRLNP